MLHVFLSIGLALFHGTADADSQETIDKAKFYCEGTDTENGTKVEILYIPNHIHGGIVFGELIVFLNRGQIHDVVRHPNRPLRKVEDHFSIRYPSGFVQLEATDRPMRYLGWLHHVHGRGVVGAEVQCTFAG